MADRVHPGESPSGQEGTNTKPPQQEPSVTAKPGPPPGTYVVQIPKDQIYRYPAPENARRYKKYAGQKHRKSRCCCCLCWTLAVLALLLILIAISAGVLFLVFRPKAPKYSVQKLSIKGFNLTASSSSTKGLTFSPEFDVTVRTENPNNKIGVYYKKGNSVAVSYSDVDLCAGVLPAFYQPSNNVTVFRTALVGSGIRLSTAVFEGLVEHQRKGEIPLGLDLKVPVRIKVGSVKTWTITVKVHCDIRVDKLRADSSIVSNKCDVDVLPWKRS